MESMVTTLTIHTSDQQVAAVLQVPSLQEKKKNLKPLQTAIELF